MPSPLPGRAHTIRPRGLSDAVDGTNAFPGAMSSLRNFVPSPTTAGLFVPRPAALAMPGFSGFTSAAQVTCLYTVGNIAYGFISTGRFVGKDEPFAFNMATQALETISGVTAASLPATQATSGEWTPPTAAAVAGSIMFTHPGFPGGAIKIGWLDISGYTLSSLTGTTNASLTITALSGNPLTAGVQPGMVVAGAGIVAGSKVVSATATTLVLDTATTGAAPGVALTITGGTATAPQWGSGDLDTNALPSVPVAVAQFSERAYFATGVGVTYSDAGAPRQRTLATQALNFRNGLDVTALASLPLYSTTQGGIVASLLCFQGTAGMQQITGDPAFSTLVVNQINNTTGTLAPNTIAPIPGGGLAFIAPDGLRVVDYTATVSDPIGSKGSGVNVPFRYAISPSRMCGCYNQGVYRVTVQNGAKSNQPYEEYWLDLAGDNRVWTGPHTFPAALIQPWQGANNTFVVAPSPSLQTAATTPTLWGSFSWGGALWGGTPVAAQLFRSDPQPSLVSTYIELGAAMTCNYATTLLPDNKDGSANSVIEGTLGMQLPGGSTVSIVAVDELGDLLDQISIASISPTATMWGAFVWGVGVWASQAAAYIEYPLPFTGPLVFKQAIYSATVTAADGVGLGNMYLRIEELTYMMRGVQAIP